MISSGTFANWKVTSFECALILLLIAILCHWVALRHNGQSLTIYTHALVDKTFEQHRPILDYHRRVMSFWYVVGLTLALLGVGCWIMAWRSSKQVFIAGRASARGVFSFFPDSHLNLAGFRKTLPRHPYFGSHVALLSLPGFDKLNARRRSSFHVEIVRLVALCALLAIDCFGKCSWWSWSWPVACGDRVP